MYYNAGFILVIIMMFVAMGANARVKTTFNHYSKVRLQRNITGSEAARTLLDRNGLQHVRVERISGSMTDHYDPRNEVVRLSETVYDQRTISGVSVACHEVGHAIQHANGYKPLDMRTAVFPAAQIGSQAAWPLIIMGLIFTFPALVNVGIVFFSFSVIFQLVTLPVEFNASARAKKLMAENGFLVDDSEIEGARKVLSAAAMTYVAAAGIAIAQLIRLLLIRGND